MAWVAISDVGGAPTESGSWRDLSQDEYVWLRFSDGTQELLIKSTADKSIFKPVRRYLRQHGTPKMPTDITYIRFVKPDYSALIAVGHAMINLRQNLGQVKPESNPNFHFLIIPERPVSGDFDPQYKVLVGKLEPIEED